MQSLSKGFYTEITTPDDMKLGGTCEATVVTMEGSTKTTDTKTFTVLKKTGDRVWLVNGSEGIIQLMED